MGTLRPQVSVSDQAPGGPALLSLKTAAARLDVTEATLRKWLAERRLPVVKLGRLTRLRLCDLEAVVKHGLPPKGAHPRKPREH